MQIGAYGGYDIYNPYDTLESHPGVPQLIRIPAMGPSESFANWIGFSAATVANGHIVCTGFAPMDDNGNVPDGLEAQMKLCLKRLRRVLSQCGADFSDLTETRVLFNPAVGTNIGPAFRAHKIAVGDEGPAFTGFKGATWNNKKWLLELEGRAYIGTERHVGLACKLGLLRA